MKADCRKELEIFNDLSTLCTSPGYAHVIAYFCFRDNTIRYSEDVSADDLMHQFSMSRLVRTEISTLIGLMFKSDIDFSLPAPNIIQKYIEATEALLLELHHSMMVPTIGDFDPSKISQEDFNPFTAGKALREPIFYGGESAYNFQYRDFSSLKYIQDSRWLEINKGFSIDNAVAVITSIALFQNEKSTKIIQGFKGTNPSTWTILQAFTFTAKDISSASGLELSLVSKVINSFIPPNNNFNHDFNALNDFNITNAYPIILEENEEYLVFQNYSLVEALYETPFYWFNEDKKYVNVAMKNRGEFTEKFSAKCLVKVFGENCEFHTNPITDSTVNRSVIPFHSDQ